MDKNELQMVTEKIDSIDKANKEMALNLGALKKSLSAINLKGYKKSLNDLSESVRKMNEAFSMNESILSSCISSFESYIRNQQYVLDLDLELKNSMPGISCNFPFYDIVPVKLKIDIQQGNSMCFGRKTDKIFDYKPESLANALKKKYESITKRPFNKEKFCKELLESYKIINRLIYKSNEVKWGQSVSLIQIYELLTISSTYKSEYKKEHFIFDIARLKDQFEVKFNNFQFNFGTSREISNTLLVTDSNARESRLSTLIIHKLGE